MKKVESEEKVINEIIQTSCHYRYNNIGRHYTLQSGPKDQYCFLLLLTNIHLKNSSF